MEITKLTANKKDNTTFYLLKGFGFTKANILRRYIVDHVPVMAITKVRFIQNSSALYDYIIAHRLGLIPLTTDLSSYLMPSECESEDAAQCTLNMTLKAKGPKIVYAEELVSKDPKVIAAQPKMPIVMLLENQELEIEVSCQLGQGVDHSKFSPAHVYYRGYPIPNVGKDADTAAIVKKYSKVFSGTGKQLKVVDPLLVTDAVEQFCEEHGVTIEHSDKDIIFAVESFGQLSAKEIMTEAVKQYTMQIKEIKEIA